MGGLQGAEFFIDDQKKTSGVKNLNFPNGLLRKTQTLLSEHNVFKSEKICNFWRKNCINDVVLTQLLALTKNSFHIFFLDYFSIFRALC